MDRIMLVPVHMCHVRLGRRWNLDLRISDRVGVARDETDVLGNAVVAVLGALSLFHGRLD